MNFTGQDWTQINIGKARPAATQQPGEGPRRNPEAQRQAKLAASTEPEKLKVLSRDSIAAIVAYRRTNNLTQRHMDQQLALPPNTINRIESRNLTPNTTMLNALNRLLKTGLRLEEE